MNKKKIGILTFQKTTNYGAQLQNYALQEYLNQYSFLNIDVINYNNGEINKAEKPLSLSESKGIKQIIKYILSGRKKIRKWNKFENFRQNFIHLTSEYDKYNIKNIENAYDYFLVGSDQVWNTDITNNDFNYMLDFISDNNKKYSYAASIGIDNISKDAILKIQNFKQINVREDSAKKILNENGIIDVNTVIDPVFLLSFNKWKSLLNVNPIADKYIFVYMIDNVKVNMKKIKKLAKKENLKIIYINNDNFDLIGIKNVREASPEDFLSYIYNAKYIITGSFHAICFSLILKKDFYYILNKKYNRNSRITDLIKKLNIKNKDITDVTEIKTSTIDYNKIYKLLNKEINTSKELLDKMISEWK